MAPRKRMDALQREAVREGQKTKAAIVKKAQMSTTTRFRQRSKKSRYYDDEVDASTSSSSSSSAAEDRTTFAKMEAKRRWTLLEAVHARESGLGGTRTVTAGVASFGLVFVLTHAVPTLVGTAEVFWGITMHEAVDFVALPILAYAYISLINMLHRSGFPSTTLWTAIALLISLMAQGHGIHMAANAINRLSEDRDTPVYQLTYTLDETIGHHVWYIAQICLLSIALVLQLMNPLGSKKAAISLAHYIVGTLHGLTWFVMIVEGQAVPLGLTFSVGSIFLSVLIGADGRARSPFVAYMGVVNAVALFTTVGWAMAHDLDFVQMSEAGLGPPWDWPGHLYTWLKR